MPPVRTARRNLAFKDLMAFVTGMRDPSAEDSAASDELAAYGATIRDRGWEHEGVGRPIYSMSRELELVAGHLWDLPSARW